MKTAPSDPKMEACLPPKHGNELPEQPYANR